MNATENDLKYIGFDEMQDIPKFLGIVEALKANTHQQPPNFSQVVENFESIQADDDEMYLFNSIIECNVNQLVWLLKNHRAFDDVKINKYKEKVIIYLYKYKIDGRRLSEKHRLNEKIFADGITDYYNDVTIRDSASLIYMRLIELGQVSIPRNEDMIKIKKISRNTKMLVLIIAVCQYDDQLLDNLYGVEYDKQRITYLFQSKYDYTVISTPSSYVTYNEMSKILRMARSEFRSNISYSDIVIFYSGHECNNYFLLSDFKSGDGHSQHGKGCFSRATFLDYFNNEALPHKDLSYRLFFIDTCHSAKKSLQSNKSDVEEYKIESNHAILYSHSDMIESYKLPFDNSECVDDIDETKSTLEVIRSMKADDPCCAVFTNALYCAFRNNVANDFKGNYNEITCDIMRKCNKPLSVFDAIYNKTGQHLMLLCPFPIRDQLALKFKKCTEKERNDVSTFDPMALLRLWGLSKYIQLLVFDEGWYELEDWNCMELNNLNYLVNIGFEKEDAIEFLNRIQQLFQLHVQYDDKENNEADEKLNENANMDKPYCKQLMKLWKLDKFTDKLIIDRGCDNAKRLDTY